MTIPSSTYRLQLRNGMTFERARKLVPYWQDLGISHLYLSPIFTAVSGSTHGYDVTDANEIDPAIGGRGDFEMLVSALQAAGMGVILDIVPNHMAASLENRWWRNVLELGSSSPHAGVFDIDWSRRLTLPQLGASFDEVLEAGDLRLVFDEVHGNLSLGYFDNLFPLRPESRDQVLRRVDDLRPNTLAALSENREFLRELHDEQHWRLMNWRDGATDLSYRRFFEVTGLVGVRVEDAAVFSATHALILELVGKGMVDGLRIDHIDGLSDPGAYLQQLRQAVGPDIYLVVEKILGPGEVLPESWPVSGTTGYEFIAAMPHLFVHADGLDRLGQHYRILAGDNGDFETVLAASKKLMAERNFAGEVSRLGRLAAACFEGTSDSDFAEVIRQLLGGFSVYRTYGTEGGLDPQDEAVLADALQKLPGDLRDDPALDKIVRLLTGQVEGPDACEFRFRFQQLSGPIMAKSMEDTAFYRYNRLIALNEVGGEPNAPVEGVAHFHELMQERLATQPHGLSASSTHDTKRGEDARARLYAISEGADVWAEGVERWRGMNGAHLSPMAESSAPGPDVEWLLYQSLAGVWAVDVQEPDLGALSERLEAYVEKAMREAKIHTDWNSPDAEYEQAVARYARHLLSAENADFRDDFQKTLLPFVAAGNLNSLAQTLIKLLAPGIPDIYQGAEILDQSLVDPDNRRVPDFTALSATPTWPGSSYGQDIAAAKRALIRSVLRLRQAEPQLFAQGRYLPLEVTGARRDHVVAFAREHEGRFAIAVAPRLMLNRIDPDSLCASVGFWEDTSLVLPAGLSGEMSSLMDEIRIPGADRIPIETLLGQQPISVLVPAEQKTGEQGLKA
ncbi:maltooligosyl trehalose synthase [Rhizobium sp. RU36D]|nr:maltooligosyl trehalose synthase [Rhizobium sp. RU36D]